jgi:hypothetical protein
VPVRSIDASGDAAVETQRFTAAAMPSSYGWIVIGAESVVLPAASNARATSEHRGGGPRAYQRLAAQ